MKKIVVLLGALLVIIAISYFAVTNLKHEKNISLSTKGNSFFPSPTPMPFEDLTIPYLRSRQYTGVLGKLEQVSAVSRYTSYSTSYLSDGLKINAQLTIPNGDMPLEGWSAIVFVHGYIPPSLYETFKNYAAYVDYLASEGFVVFKVDLRGHGNSEGTPGGAYYSSDYIIDVLNAKSALQKSDFVNPQKIGLWGHSMAGNVVSRAMAVDTSIPAVVIWAGAVYTYSDMQKYGIQDNSYRPPSDQSQRTRRRTQLFEKYGQFNSESAFWKSVPMTNYLADIKGAIQIHHAVNDDVVNIGYSRDFDLLLDNTSIYHELNEYPSGGHNITGVSFSQAMRKTADFFKKYL